MSDQQHANESERSLSWKQTRFLFGWAFRAIMMTAVVKWAAVTLIVACATVAGFAFTPVHHDELVLVTSFGKIVEGPLQPGIHWYMPYFNVIRRYPTTRQFLLITDKTVEPDKPFVDSLFQEGVAVSTQDNVPISVVLEVSYRIEKSEKTVDAFVSNFGRLSTDYGTEKIEKLIADACRNATRAKLANSPLAEIEAKVGEKSSEIKDIAVGTPANTTAMGSLQELGIAIVTLGYRLQINPDVLAARIRESTKLQQENLRKLTVEAQAKADRRELELQTELSEMRLKLAQNERMAFEASPESSPVQLRSDLQKRWDGQLPQVLLLGDVPPALAERLEQSLSPKVLTKAPPAAVGTGPNRQPR